MINLSQKPCIGEPCTSHTTVQTLSAPMPHLQRKYHVHIPICKLHRTIILPILSHWDNLAPPQTPPCEHYFLSKFAISNFPVMVWSHQGYFGPTFCTDVIRDERTTPWTCLATMKLPQLHPPLGGRSLSKHMACSGR